MSDCQCIIAAWSDSPLPIAVVQLVTTLLIAGLDKSLHTMSKEFKSSNCQSLLDLDLKSIDVGLLVKRKSSIRVVFKLCSRTHTLSVAHFMKIDIKQENNHEIKELGHKLHLVCSFLSKSSFWSDVFFVWISFMLLSTAAQRGPL